jgi:mitogen-activated protein kinase kinase
MTIRAAYGYEESSFGYGQLNNGLDSADSLRLMTSEIRQTLSRSRHDSPNPSYTSLPKIQSRPSSRAGSIDGDDLAEGLEKTHIEEGNAGRKGLLNVDPDKLIRIKRLGEGAGGAVELVKDPGTGRTMAKKVC